jgi:hypothetical protein
MFKDLVWQFIDNVWGRRQERIERQLDQVFARPVITDIKEKWLMKFSVGDRVLIKGLAWRGESDRVGTIVELYRGQRSAVDPGLEMASVRWDDNGLTERGYILTSGTLRAYTAVPTAQTQNGEA